MGDLVYGGGIVQQSEKGPRNESLGGLRANQRSQASSMHHTGGGNVCSQKAPRGVEGRKVSRS